MLLLAVEVPLSVLRAVEVPLSVLRALLRVRLTVRLLALVFLLS